MDIGDIFEVAIEKKIPPVIKVGDRDNQTQLADEVSNFVVTPTLEQFIDEFLDGYSDTYHKFTEEVGVWISGYFGSGKSHFAKLLSLIVENRVLDGTESIRRFETRIPHDSNKHGEITRNLSLIPNCNCTTLAFNINTLTAGHDIPLAVIVLQQFYLSKGYTNNHILARVIETRLSELGLYEKFKSQMETKTKKEWDNIRVNISVYYNTIQKVVSDLLPDEFPTPESVKEAIELAMSGESINVELLVETILMDIEDRRKESGKNERMLLVFDELGFWISDDQQRLAEAQAFVEEIAIRGKGKIWLIVTTHEDMGTIVRSIAPMKGDFKKMEDRFRYRFHLTTENIEDVLEKRLLRKTIQAEKGIGDLYEKRPGQLQEMGLLDDTHQSLPECTKDGFIRTYPFFPYQIHLIPEVVKGLRSLGGRSEQLSGSTRTLIAITQDIIRGGRRDYLRQPLGFVASFDEIYENLEGDGEIPSDYRYEVSRIEKVITDSTEFTRRVAETLILIGHVNYIPRTINNISKLLIEHIDDDILDRRKLVEVELKRLSDARMVSRSGDEYEFLTGTKQEFEDLLGNMEAEMRGRYDTLITRLGEFVTDTGLGFNSVTYKNIQFQIKLFYDDKPLSKEGDVEIRIYSPLQTIQGLGESELIDDSLDPANNHTFYVLSSRVDKFEDNIIRYFSMKDLIDDWTRNTSASRDAKDLAEERRNRDLIKLRKQLREGIQEGIRNSKVIYQGSIYTLSHDRLEKPYDLLKKKLVEQWSKIYTQFDMLPYRVKDEAKAIRDVLTGKTPPSKDVNNLNIYSTSGDIKLNSILVDTVKNYISARQSRNERTLGHHLLSHYSKPPYGWDRNALRIGVAALIRAGQLRFLVGKIPLENPADLKLQNAMRKLRDFQKAELQIESVEVSAQVLKDSRKLIIKLTGNRKIDETPAAIAEAATKYLEEIMQNANSVRDWASPAGFPLTDEFNESAEVIGNILSQPNPTQQVKDIHANEKNLGNQSKVIKEMNKFILQHGRDYLEIRDNYNELRSVMMYLTNQKECNNFISNWKAAHEQMRQAEKDTWSSLKTGNNEAYQALERTVQKKYKEAKRELQGAKRIAQDRLSDAGLDPETDGQETIARFSELQRRIDETEDDVELIRIFERLSHEIQNIKNNIEDITQEKSKNLVRKITAVRIKEHSKKSIITNEDDWDEFVTKLDRWGKKTLKDKDIEL